MSQANTSMNFLPEDYVEKRQATRAAVVFIGLLLLVVGGIVGTYMYAQWNMRGVFQSRDQVNAAFEEASNKILKAQELEQQKAHMIAKADTITTLMERVRRSILLGELTRMRPKGVNFLALELKTRELDAGARPNPDLDKARRAQEGLPGGGKSPAVDVTVTLTGTAPTDADVASYMTALQKSPLLAGVALLYSEEYRKTKEDPVVRRFNVEMHINPEMDLRSGNALATALPKN
jgi:Tfp pilus assembly protein PilN